MLMYFGFDNFDDDVPIIPLLEADLDADMHNRDDLEKKLLDASSMAYTLAIANQLSAVSEKIEESEVELRYMIQNLSGVEERIEQDEETLDIMTEEFQEECPYDTPIIGPVLYEIPLLKRRRYYLQKKLLDAYDENLSEECRSYVELSKIVNDAEWEARAGGLDWLRD